MNLLNQPDWLYYNITATGEKVPIGGIHSAKMLFAEAQASPEASKYSGIGKVIRAESDEVFIDLDDYDPRLLIQENLLRILRPSSYVHTSSSRKGFHIICLVKGKNKYKVMKRSRFEIYFKDRFVAFVNPLESEGGESLDTLTADSTKIFHYLYSGLSFLFEETPPPSLMAMLHRGKVDEYDSPSEYDHALAAEAFKYTTDFDTIYGILLLSESDPCRLRNGKGAKLLEKPDYVKRTVKQLGAGWDAIEAVGKLDRVAYARSNLVELGGKPFLRRGQIAVVKALLNSGKGHFSLSTVASVMCDNGLGAKTLQPDLKAVYFDTEMGLDETMCMKDMVEARVGRELDGRIRFFSLCDIRTEERFRTIYSIVRGIKPDIIIIDHVRDLVFDSNDASSSRTSVDELQVLARGLDCAILGTIHTNPGQEYQKAKGTYGSLIEEKAFCTIHLIRDHEDVKVIHARQVKSRRSGYFEEFSFSWDSEKGYFTLHKEGTYGTQKDRGALDL
jgi:hypothetical protein